MGGPSQQTLNTQNQLTQSQISTQQAATAQSQQEYQQQQALEAPAISFNTALASGDPSAVMKALAPQLTGISQATAANKENILESTGPGAARDVALSQNALNQGNQTASLEANAELQAPNTLANIGAGLGSNSLQALGASINAGGAASSANQVSINAAEQSKASTLGFLGTLAGAGTSLATGGLFSGGGGGGGGGTMNFPTTGPAILQA